MEIEVSEKEKRRSDPYIWGIIIILYIPFSLPDIHCRSIQCIKYTDLQEW